MRLFGNGRAQEQAPDIERQRTRREAVEHAREEQYLRKLAQMIEEGVPTHQLAAPPPVPKPVAASPVVSSPGPPPRPVEVEDSLPVVEEASEDPFVALEGGDVSAAGDFSYGDIVLLGEDSIAIYNRFIPDKEYDVVYTLQPDGSLAPKGIPLAAHGARIIGRLPAAMTRAACSQVAWDRDMIVFHLYEFQDTKRIPHPTAARNSDGKVVTKHLPSETVVREAPPRSAANPLQRGRRFAVMFGDRRWEAVYWGHDDQGALVAHNTTGEWALMHLDLRRFEGSIQFLEVLAPEDLAEVERGLLASSGA